ncbi:MAG: AraC family transcriptional regulator [Pseudomonadota bacterium]
MSEIYKNRINRVVDYIQTNLDTPLSVKQLSKIACFSEFHFNRIFKKAMGESAYQFIRRLRLEKSADLLLTKPEIPITEIAMVCGFATSSSFAKSFKEQFHMSATEWRNCSNAHFNKKSQPIEVEPGRFSFVNGSPAWTFYERGSIRQVVIENITPITIAYIRYVGPYKGDDTLFDQLLCTTPPMGCTAWICS